MDFCVKTWRFFHNLHMYMLQLAVIDVAGDIPALIRSERLEG